MSCNAFNQSNINKMIAVNTRVHELLDEMIEEARTNQDAVRIARVMWENQECLEILRELGGYLNELMHPEKDCW